MFLCLVAKMSDLFLVQQINIRFYVKLEKMRHLYNALQGL